MAQLAQNVQQQQILKQEQKTTINVKTGKKKIQPKIERIFDDSNALVNPHLNPFMQLTDVATKPTFSKPMNGSLPEQKPPQLPSIKETTIGKIIDENKKLPTMNQIAKLQQQQNQSQNLAVNQVQAQNPVENERMASPAKVNQVSGS